MIKKLFQVGALSVMSLTLLLSAPFAFAFTNGINGTPTATGTAQTQWTITCPNNYIFFMFLADPISVPGFGTGTCDGTPQSNGSLADNVGNDLQLGGAIAGTYHVVVMTDLYSGDVNTTVPYATLLGDSTFFADYTFINSGQNTLNTFFSGIDLSSVSSSFFGGASNYSSAFFVHAFGDSGLAEMIVGIIVAGMFVALLIRKVLQSTHKVTRYQIAANPRGLKGFNRPTSFR